MSTRPAWHAEDDLLAGVPGRRRRRRAGRVPRDAPARLRRLPRPRSAASPAAAHDELEVAWDRLCRRHRPPLARRSVAEPQSRLLLTTAATPPCCGRPWSPCCSSAVVPLRHRPRRRRRQGCVTAARPGAARPGRGRGPRLPGVAPTRPGRSASPSPAAGLRLVALRSLLVSLAALPGGRRRAGRGRRLGPGRPEPAGLRLVPARPGAGRARPARRHHPPRTRRRSRSPLAAGWALLVVAVVAAHRTPADRRPGGRRRRPRHPDRGPRGRPGSPCCSRSSAGTPSPTGGPHDHHHRTDPPTHRRLRVDAVTKSFGRTRAVDGSRSARRAAWSACSAPTAPARPPCCG